MAYRSIKPGSRSLNTARGAALPGAVWLLLLAMLLAGCAGQPFQAPDVASAPFLERRLTDEEGPVRISVAVPDAAETEALFGMPLYDQGIQPVWIEVENNDTRRVRLSVWSVDPDYYSPLEVSWMNRKSYSKSGRAEMDRWFHDNAVQRLIASGETRSGFVFTHLEPGTKGFNVDVLATGQRAFNFTFFVPMAGFTPDYMAVNYDKLYTEDEYTNVDNLDDLRTALEALPCCATDESGTQRGIPMSVALVGTGEAVLRALMRANWQETELDAASTAAARQQHYNGRRPDGTFVKLRADGSERKELRLWMTPIRIDDERVWLGQIGNLVGDRRQNAKRSIIGPDIDTPMLALMQDFWYSQSLTGIGFVRASEPISPDEPQMTFTGYEYFTNGLRGMLWLSEDPIGLDEVENVDWEAYVRE